MNNNKIGLKLWSTNNIVIDKVTKIYNEKLFNYLELYIVPKSYNKVINFWLELNIPIVIHAPHFYGGLNLSDYNKKDNNKLLLKETFNFADKLNAEKVIIHPGVNGELSETIKQFKKNYDERIVIENKPFLGLKNEICIGSKVEEIKKIIEEVKVGFCLDFGHAICSANAQDINPLNYIKKFIELNPSIYHLTDGDYKSKYDSHLNYGKGNYPIAKIVKLIPENSMITNEAKRENIEDFSQFINDIRYLENIHEK